MKNILWDKEKLNNFNLNYEMSYIKIYNLKEIKEILQDVNEKINELNNKLTGNLIDDVETRKSISDLEMFQELMTHEQEYIEQSDDELSAYDRLSDKESEMGWYLKNATEFLTPEQVESFSNNEEFPLDEVAKTIKNELKSMALIASVTNEQKNRDNVVIRLDKLLQGDETLAQYFSDSISNLDYAHSSEDLGKALQILQNKCDNILLHYGYELEEQSKENEKNEEEQNKSEEEFKLNNDSLNPEILSMPEELDKLLNSQLLNRNINSMNLEKNRQYEEMINQTMKRIIEIADEQVKGDYNEIAKKEDFIPTNYLVNLQNYMMELNNIRNLLIKNQRELYERDIVSEYVSQQNYDRNKNINNEFRNNLIHNLTDEHKEFVQGVMKNGRISVSELVDALDNKFGVSFVNKVMEQTKEFEIFKKDELVKDAKFMDEAYDEVQKNIEELINKIEQRGLTYDSEEAKHLKEYIEKIQNSKSMTSEFITKTNQVFGKTEITDLDSLIKSADNTINRLYSMREHYKISGMEKDLKREQEKLREQIKIEQLTYKYNKTYADARIKQEKEIKRKINSFKFKLTKPPKIVSAIFTRANLAYQKYYNTQMTQPKKSFSEKIKDGINYILSKFTVTDKPTTNIRQRANLVQERGLNDQDIKDYLKSDEFKAALKEVIKDLQVENNRDEKDKEEQTHEVKKEQVKEQVKETQPEQTKKDNSIHIVKNNAYTEVTKGCNDLTQLSMLINADTAKTEVDYKHDEIILHGFKGEKLRFNHETFEIIENTFPSIIKGKEIDYEQMIGSITDKQIKGEMKNNEYRRKEGKDILEGIQELKLSNPEHVQIIEETFAKALNCDKATIDLDSKVVQAIKIEDGKVSVYTASLDNALPIKEVSFDKESNTTEQYLITDLLPQTVVSGIRERMSQNDITLDEEIENATEERTDDERSEDEPIQTAERA